MLTLWIFNDWLILSVGISGAMISWLPSDSGTTWQWKKTQGESTFQKLHRVCDWNYLQNYIKDMLQCTMNHWINICKAEGVTKIECQIFPCNDLSYNINQYIPLMQNFTKCVHKIMHPLILWSRHPHGMTCNQMIIRIIQPIILLILVLFYSAEVNFQQPLT